MEESANPSICKALVDLLADAEETRRFDLAAVLAPYPQKHLRDLLLEHAHLLGVEPEKVPDVDTTALVATFIGSAELLGHLSTLECSEEMRKHYAEIAFGILRACIVKVGGFLLAMHLNEGGGHWSHLRKHVERQLADAVGWAGLATVTASEFERMMKNDERE